MSDGKDSRHLQFTVVALAEAPALTLADAVWSTLLGLVDHVNTRPLVSLNLKQWLLDGCWTAEKPCQGSPATENDNLKEEIRLK